MAEIFEIALYRTKPVEITITEPLTPENRHAICAWVTAAGTRAEPGPDGADFALVVETLEGEYAAAYGDRIVAGTRGEYYPIKPGPFADKYERVEG